MGWSWKHLPAHVQERTLLVGAPAVPLVQPEANSFAVWRVAVAFSLASLPDASKTAMGRALPCRLRPPAAVKRLRLRLPAAEQAPPRLATGPLRPRQLHYAALRRLCGRGLKENGNGSAHIMLASPSHKGREPRACSPFYVLCAHMCVMWASTSPHRGREPEGRIPLICVCAICCM